MLQQLDEYHGLPDGIFSCDEHYAGSIRRKVPNYAP